MRSVVRAGLFAALGLTVVAVELAAAAQQAPRSAELATSPEENEDGDAPIAYAPPRATATLLTPPPVWLSQKVEIEVVLWRDDAQPDKPAPDFSEVRVRNAIAVRTDYAPPPETRTEEGVRYLLQKRRYLVFPQGIGMIEVPAIEASWATDEGRERVSTEAFELEARPPPNAGTGNYVVAESMTVSDSIDGDIERLRVGDSVTRTITVAATDTDAMMLPAIAAASPKGLAAYPGKPTITTRIDRGRYKAERVDTVTYVAEQWGFYELPPVEVRWFQPATGQWQTARVEGHSFRARVNPELGLSAFGTLSSNARRAATLILLFLLGWLAYTLWQARTGRLRQKIREARAKGPSERQLFLRVLRAASKNDANATLNATYRWITTYPERQDDPPTLDAVARRHPTVERPCSEIAQSLFSKEGPAKSWNGRRFASSFGKARRESLRGEGKQHEGLAPLNPSRPPRG